MKHKTTTTRRSFIKKAILGISGSFAIAGSGKLFAIQQQTPTAEPSSSTSQGYRETHHVRQYYKKARF